MTGTSRQLVEALYGSQLRRLELADLYRTGDVSVQVLRALGVQVTAADSAQLHGALPKHADRVIEQGIVAALLADGLESVPLFRHRLRERIGSCRDAPRRPDTIYYEALTEHRKALSVARFRELEWLGDNLRVPVADRLSMRWRRLPAPQTRLWVTTICWEGRGLA